MSETIVEELVTRLHSLDEHMTYVPDGFIAHVNVADFTQEQPGPLWVKPDNLIFVVPPKSESAD
jgi:hypothetical protein